MDNVDLQFSGLFDRLYADGVVDVQEMDEIKSQHTHVRQNEKLLSLLSRKSVQQFHSFLHDLDSSGQRHIRDTLDNRQGFRILFYTALLDVRVMIRHYYRKETYSPGIMPPGRYQTLPTDNIVRSISEQFYCFVCSTIISRMLLKRLEYQ